LIQTAFNERVNAHQLFPLSLYINDSQYYQKCVSILIVP